MENMIENIKVITLNPEDVLVVNLKENMPIAATLAYAKHISDKIGELFPNHKCLILSHGAELNVIRQESLTSER